jgi:hypothetical protein
MIGVVAFGEHVVIPPPALTAELLAVAGLVTGIVIVTRRAARLIAADQQLKRQAESASNTWG